MPNRTSKNHSISREEYMKRLKAAADSNKQVRDKIAKHANEKYVHEAKQTEMLEQLAKVLTGNN